jgi:hypothetical protein
MSYVGVTLNGVLDLGFYLLTTLTQQLVTALNYTTITEFHNLQFSRVLSVTRRFLVTAYNKSYSFASGLRFSLNCGSIPTDYSLCLLGFPRGRYKASPLAHWWLPSSSCLSCLFHSRCLAMSLHAIIIFTNIIVISENCMALLFSH